jgi:hypothetical protein
MLAMRYALRFRLMASTYPIILRNCTPTMGYIPIIQKRTIQIEWADHAKV